MGEVQEATWWSGWVTWERAKRFAGVIVFVFFIVLAFFWNSMFDAIMNSQIQLSPHSVLYRMWVRNPIPIHLEIYLFNFTNAEDFERDKTVVPNFEEVGPFYFEETREKVDVSWNDAEETVTFNQSKKWRLVTEISRDMSLRVTNVNPIASTIAYMSRLWTSQLQKEIANALLNAHEPLTVTASAQEWIFDGIPDEFLEIFETLRKVTEIPIPYNRFGWFYQRNGSSSFDGVFTIKTGASSRHQLGNMVAWNHENKTEHYVDACALIRGSTGEVLPPLKPFQETLSVFAPDICSYVTLRYARTVNFGGLSAYEYVGDETVFENGTSNPENKCFYLGESCPSGSRNVSSCRFGSPAFISFPHFYLADPYFTEKITGLSPDENKHKFSLKVEPTTGIPLAVDAAFQINFLIESYSWCDEFRGVPKIHVPMLWFKQAVEMPNGYSAALVVALFVQTYGGYLVLVLLLLILFVSSRRRSCSHKKDNPE